MLQITNEMSFQLGFSLPGLLIHRAPAEELLVPPATPQLCHGSSPCW